MAADDTAQHSTKRQRLAPAGARRFTASPKTSVGYLSILAERFATSSSQWGRFVSERLPSLFGNFLPKAAMFQLAFAGSLWWVDFPQHKMPQSSSYPAGMRHSGTFKNLLYMV